MQTPNAARPKITPKLMGDSIRRIDDHSAYTSSDSVSATSTAPGVNASCVSSPSQAAGCSRMNSSAGGPEGRHLVRAQSPAGHLFSQSNRIILLIVGRAVTRTSGS